jgi:hypothetical protein
MSYIPPLYPRVYPDSEIGAPTAGRFRLKGRAREFTPIPRSGPGAPRRSFSRRLCPYSKKLENFKAAIGLYFGYHNFAKFAL